MSTPDADAAKREWVHPGDCRFHGGDRCVVWLPYMAERQKTTVYLEADAYQKLKFVARESGVAPAEMIRTAIAEFLDRRATRRLPSSLGAGRSRAGNVAARAEEFLQGFGRAK
jgi:hypothetical protein